MTPNLVKLLEHPTAIIGMTGAGKTFAAKGIVEQLLAMDRRVIIIDPTGAWYGLRSGADGSPKGGFPVLIFGGDHADVPLSPDAGREIAEMLAERHVQCILDVSDMTGGERSRFMAAFLETMFIKNRTHVHLIVDEADDICPQKPMPGQERMKGAFDKVVRKGRRRGFIPVMITQRPAVIDKSVLSQAGSMIILKLMSPQDQKAIRGWVEGNATARAEISSFMASLSTLKRGTGWIWSPAEKVKDCIQFPAIRTYDSSRTPTVGEEIRPPSLTAVDVKALRDAIAALSAAKEEGKAGESVQNDENYAKAMREAEQRGYARGYEMARNDKHANSYRLGFHNAALAIMEAAKKAADLDPDDVDVPAIDAGSPTAKAAETTGSNPVPAVKPRPKAEPKSNGEITPALQRVVDAIAWWHEQGFEAVERKRACVVAGLSPSASTFNVYISRLAEAGIVEAGDPGKIRLTDFGMSMASPMPNLKPVEAAADLLDGQPRRVFEMIAGHYPQAVARGDLADALGLSRKASTLNVYIGKAVSRGLVENAGQGRVRAADFLFQ